MERMKGSKEKRMARSSRRKDDGEEGGNGRLIEERSRQGGRERMVV